NEKIQDRRAYEKNSVARNHKHREPGRKTAVLRVELAPVTNAQGDDPAKQQPFIGNWIENDSQRTALMVVTRDVSVQAVTQLGNKEDSDGRETLPLIMRAELNGC